MSFIGDLSYAYSAYGQTVPLDSHVIARLVYDTEVPANYNLGGCDCATYRQQAYNGLSVSFGPMIVQADEYDIHVINNFGPDGGSDFLRIVYSSTQTPPFDEPLYVDGVAQPAGVLVISLRDVSGTALGGAALPDPAAFSNFASREALLKEAPEQSAYDIAANLEVSVTLGRVAGDFDFDSDVDGADLLIWQRTLGSAAPSPADSNLDGQVDADDLAHWRQQFGAPSSGAAVATPVPEPTTAALALAWFIAAAAQRARGVRGRRS